MNILVTGGAGYLGYFVTKKLLHEGHHITVLDNLTYKDAGLKDFLELDRFTFILGDICSLKTVVKAVRNQDAVIALAAIVGDPACQLKPEETVKTNYLATKILADVCERHGVKRIVFASSCSVYGDTGNRIANEKFPVKPLSLYAETRIMSETMLLKRKKLDVVILRLATIFGLSKRMRFDLVVNFLTAKATKDKTYTVYGGKQWRPLVHVQDAAAAFVKAVLAPRKIVAGEIFNVGTEKNNVTIEQIGMLVHLAIPQAKMKIEKAIEDKRNYRISFEKIRERLGFTCKYSIKDGINEIYNALKKGTIKNFQDDIYYNVRYIYKNKS